MSPIPSRVAAGALSVALLVPIPVRAQEAPGSGSVVGTPASRVRALDAMARRALDLGMQRSPTLARMVADLQQTDLVVTIQAACLPKLVRGDARVVAAAGTVRHVRIRLGVPAATSDLVAVLGHELRHALELAAMPEIRDGSTLARAYARIGIPLKGNGYWETAAALEAGETVARELKACKKR